MRPATVGSSRPATGRGKHQRVRVHLAAQAHLIPALELDPVTPGGSESDVPDALEDAAAPLDRLHRGDIVDRADGQHPI